MMLLRLIKFFSSSGQPGKERLIKALDINPMTYDAIVERRNAIHEAGRLAAKDEELFELLQNVAQNDRDGLNKAKARTWIQRIRPGSELKSSPHVRIVEFPI